MDKNEELSDCSESSKYSERLSSNLSTFSGLNEYENEFLDLKELVNTECLIRISKINPTGVKAVINSYEKQIENLNYQLKNALRIGDEYKQDLQNLEKKKNVEYNERIEKLLKQNKQLETDLSTANSQIERLIKFYSIKDKSTETAVLENRILELEKSNHELINQNYLLSNEINQCNFQKSETENESDNLRCEVNEMKLKLGATVKCVDELKKKIAEQHVELHNFSQSNIKLSHSLDLTSSELQYVKKSENWYRKELHQLQKERNSLCDIKLQNEKTLALNEEKIKQVELEVNNWKRACDELRQNSLKEKETILKQFETKTVDKNRRANVHDATADIEGIITNYEKVITDLNHDIANIKANFQNQQKCLEDTSKENLNLLSQLSSLENYLKEKENVIKKLEDSKRDLNKKLEASRTDEIMQNTKLLELNKKYANLEIELGVKNQEKIVVEKSVQRLKEQFKTLRNKYTCLKDDIHKKNQELSQLTYEKQELCTTSNQQICKLRQNIEELSGELERLKDNNFSIESATGQNCCSYAESEALNQELLNLQKKFEKLQTHYLYLLGEYQPTGTNFAKIFFAVSNLQQENEVESFLKQTEYLDSNYSVVDLFRRINKLCKVDDEDFISCMENLNLNDKQMSYIRIMVNRILIRLQIAEKEIIYKNNCVMDLEKKLIDLMKRSSRIENLQDRCKILQKKTNENEKMLQVLSQNRSERKANNDVQHLQALLQVKIQEEKDKQKRYEKNYHILLKKLKEHMKGRNTAEKHNAYLQQLNAALSDECNKFKVQTDLKNSEVIELTSRLENCICNNGKLKEVVNLAKKSTTEFSRCIDHGELKVVLKDHENCDIMSSKLKTKEDLIKKLQGEKEQILLELSSVDSENKANKTKLKNYVEINETLRAKLEDNENILVNEKSKTENLRSELIKMEHKCSVFYDKNRQLNEKVENLTQSNIDLQEQAGDLNSHIHQKSDELNDADLKSKRSEHKWSEKQRNMEELIARLKCRVYEFQKENNAVKSEKFFLQRLCSDLKFALKINVNHNKILKEYMNNALKEDRSVVESISLSRYTIPVKHCDDHVDKLLKENTNLHEDKAYIDIQEGINSVKSKIFYLQNQILATNVPE